MHLPPATAEDAGCDQWALLVVLGGFKYLLETHQVPFEGNLGVAS